MFHNCLGLTLFSLLPNSQYLWPLQKQTIATEVMRISKTIHGFKWPLGP